MTTPKIVLISGANKGIGFATAAALGAAGHTVLLGCRDESRGEQAARSLIERGVEAHLVPLDVTDDASIAAAAAHIEQKFGRLDVLINNAAISRDRPHPPTELPVTKLREIYETNVFGVVALTNAMLPLLRRSPAPYLGNVSSGLGTVAFLTNADSPHWHYANLLGYNSSKAALNAITLIYVNNLRAEGITVNALSPGVVATDLNNHAGELSADDGGANIARQVLEPEGNGVFLNENGGTYPW